MKLIIDLPNATLAEAKEVNDAIADLLRIYVGDPLTAENRWSLRMEGVSR